MNQEGELAEQVEFPKSSSARDQTNLTADNMGTCVMYLLLRKDLETTLKWPIGALCTQAAHAATACLWTYRDDQDVKEYMADLNHMHKITLAVENEEMLKGIVARLEEASVDHRVWVEDNMPVCIAIKPQPRAPLKVVLGRLPLYKRFESHSAAKAYMVDDETVRGRFATLRQFSRGKESVRAEMPCFNHSTLPSLVQVVEESQRCYNECVFQTGCASATQPIPSPFTSFLASDTGNASPKFIRSSIYEVPADDQMLEKARLPFTLALTPFAELDPREMAPPIVDPSRTGPVRCGRCLAYISSQFEFIDGGRRFCCPFCEEQTLVPPDYFAHLDWNGKRVDYGPELYYGSYEFVASKQYCPHDTWPNKPAFVFLVDVSYQSVRSGLVSLFCANLASLLESLPRESGASKSVVKVALATYDQTIHFYDLTSATHPRMCVVTDVNDVFVPFLDGFFIDFEAGRESLERCLHHICSTFSATLVTQTLLGPAVQVALRALELERRNGKIFVFHTNLPTFEAFGQLKNRESRRPLGIDDEKTLLTEATDYYSNLSKSCVQSGVCIDLFLFPNSFVDLASMAPMFCLTGGSIYKYLGFDARKDGRRFLTDLHRAISRPVAFDVRVRVRTSTGIQPVSFVGSFYMNNLEDMQIAALDCDKSLQVELKYNDNLRARSYVHIQVASLFTSCGGERRIRIQNLTLPVTTDYSAMYGSVEQFTVFSFLLKDAVTTMLDKGVKKIKEEATKRCAQMLVYYRTKCSEHVSLNQLILPDELKLLPLMINCLLKSDVLRDAASLTVDDRVWLMRTILSMSVDSSTRLLYPAVLQLTQLSLSPDNELVEMPAPLNPSAKSLQQTHAYLIDNGIHAYIWVGSQVSVEWLQNVCGIRDWICLRNTILPRFNTWQSRAVHQLLNQLHKGRSQQPQLHVVCAGNDAQVQQMMVEDSQGEDLSSYSQFIYDLHHQIQRLID